MPELTRAVLRPSRRTRSTASIAAAVLASGAVNAIVLAILVHRSATPIVIGAPAPEAPPAPVITNISVPITFNLAPLAPSPAPAPAPAPPADPKVTAAVAAARKAPAGAKALAAWKAVLVLDGTHPEALFRVAAAQAAAKQVADALATLGVLGGAPRPDAIEWLIEARFDPAFAALRSDAKFRTAVGLDRKPTSMYERMMGFGGQWEQSGTACDQPEIRFSALRDRTFKLRVKTACQGSVYDTPFKGTWRIEGARIVLTFPNKGKAVSAADETVCGFEPVGDEEGLKCTIGRNLEFTALPARR